LTNLEFFLIFFYQEIFKGGGEMEKSKKYLIISTVIVLAYSTLFYWFLVDLEEVGFIKGFIIPVLATFFLVVGAQITLSSKFKKSNYEIILAGGYLKGLIAFVLCAVIGTLITAMINPTLWLSWIAVIHLPGTLIYLFLNWLRPDQLRVIRHEPFIVWAMLTLSWLIWAGAGASIAFFRQRDKVKKYKK
jgi:F0F1-type ATP synthase assembly protein I